MIEPNEIRIGSIIIQMGIDYYSAGYKIHDSTDDEIIQVTKENILEVIDNYNEYSSIPLTEEWLVKLGFKECDYDLEKGYIKYNRQTSDYGCEYKASNFWIVPTSDDDYYRIPVDIKYVHQLQNLFFALTGTELTLSNDK